VVQATGAAPIRSSLLEDADYRRQPAESKKFCLLYSAKNDGFRRTTTDGTTMKEVEGKRGKHLESLSFPVYSAISEASIGKYPQGDSNPLPISRKGKAREEVTANPPEFAAQTLAHEKRFGPEIDADLDRLIDAWPTLPEAIRAGILAMVEAACDTKKRE
jgi:hypothetical protein